MPCELLQLYIYQIQFLWWRSLRSLSSGCTWNLGAGPSAYATFLESRAPRFCEDPVHSKPQEDEARQLGHPDFTSRARGICPFGVSPLGVLRSLKVADLVAAEVILASLQLFGSEGPGEVE